MDATNTGRTDYTSGDVSPLALAMDAIMCAPMTFRTIAGFRKGFRALLLRRKYLKLHGRPFEGLLDSYLASTENVDTASTRAVTVR